MSDYSRCCRGIILYNSTSGEPHGIAAAFLQNLLSAGVVADERAADTPFEVWISIPHPLFSTTDLVASHHTGSNATNAEVAAQSYAYPERTQLNSSGNCSAPAARREVDPLGIVDCCTIGVAICLAVLLRWRMVAHCHAETLERRPRPRGRAMGLSCLTLIIGGGSRDYRELRFKTTIIPLPYREGPHQRSRHLPPARQPIHRLAALDAANLVGAERHSANR